MPKFASRHMLSMAAAGAIVARRSRLARAHSSLVTTLAVLLLVSCSGAKSGTHAPVFVQSPHKAMQGLPFSEAVRVGDTLYLSGQIGTRPGTLELVPGGIEAETRQTLDNIKAILERNGSSMGQVVKCSVFLADIAEWPRLNEIYKTYFTGSPPARSALAASGLALGARVEIECIAVVDAQK